MDDLIQQNPDQPEYSTPVLVLLEDTVNNSNDLGKNKKSDIYFYFNSQENEHIALENLFYNASNQ